MFVGKPKYKILLILLIANCLFFGFLWFLSKDRSKTDIQQEALRIEKSCQNGGEGCYSEQFSHLLAQHDLKSVIQIFNALQGINSSLQSCHMLAHSISIAAVSKNPDSWLNVFEYIDPEACARGFFHGVIEGYSSFNPKFILDEKTIPSICSELSKYAYSGKSRNKYVFACAHPIGHLILVQTEGNVAKAVNICDKLPQQLQHDCYTGVFMEDQERINLSLHGVAAPLPLDKAHVLEQEKVCQGYSGLAATTCWETMSILYAKLFRSNHEKVYEYCSHAPVSQNREECAIEGASNLVFMSIEGNFGLVDSSTVCEPFLPDDEIFKDCIARVVRKVVHSVPTFTEKLVEFCEGLPNTYHKFCYNQIGTELAKVIPTPEQRQLCKKVPKEWLTACLGL